MKILKTIALVVLGVLLGILALVLVAAVLTTPSIGAERQRVKMDYSHHYTGPGRSSGDPCGKAVSEFEGTAWLPPHEHLLGGAMSIKFCYRIIQGPFATDLIVGKPQVNAWGDARFGWSFDGITSKVKGHGKHCADSHCWEYVYRRYYFKFHRGFKGIEQTCTPYVNITVRGNGTYVTGHSDGGVC